MKTLFPFHLFWITMARRDIVTARKTTQASVKLQTRGNSIVHFRIQHSGLTSVGKRPQGIKKGERPNPLRRSARLDHSIEIHEAQQKSSQQHLPSPVSDVKHLHVSRRTLFCDGSLTQYSVRSTPPTPLPSKPPKRKRETEQQSKRALSKSDHEHLVLDLLVQDVDSMLHIGPRHTTGRKNTSMESGKMSQLLARKKSTTSLRRKRSDSRVWRTQLNHTE